MAASKPTVQPTRKATDLRAQIPQRGGFSPCAAAAFLVGAGPSPACRMRLRFSACFGTLPSTRQEGDRYAVLKLRIPIVRDRSVQFDVITSSDSY